MNKLKIKLTVNNKEVEKEIPANWRLVDLLRDGFGMTGCKEGCGVGECGACTILLDGEAVASCLIMAGQVQGREVTTIDGISNGEELHPIQQAFIEKGAVQCGYCTPGMILSSLALLRKNVNPTEKEIKVAISGNLCRCTGYKQIVDAIKLAADRMKESE
ncbi:MAG: (2Fe-2S)-binding protein [Bacillota bacterium]